jgi:hypothetical protein
MLTFPICVTHAASGILLNLGRINKPYSDAIHKADQL